MEKEKNENGLYAKIHPASASHHDTKSKHPFLIPFIVCLIAILTLAATLAWSMTRKKK